jgi:hypothetical protein
MVMSTIEYNKYKSRLDDVKSTITISMGTKNRLRTIKGNMSYEEFINYLIQIRNEKSHEILDNSNMIEYNKFKRVESTFSDEDNYKIIFLYNKFFPSDNFRFDIEIKNVIYKGERINYESFLRENLIHKNISNKELELDIYFKLLSFIIKLDILPNFKHKGSFKDYFSWKEEFKMLRLSDRSFEEDVMEKLEDFQRGY